MNNFLRKVYLYRFFDAFNLVSGIFALYFASKNLDPFQISILIAIWSITSLALEVPLGAVADKYPRKYLLMVAPLLTVIGFSLWLMDGFIFYALGFVLWGAKNALQSGTMEAFLYDELKEYGKQDYFQSAFGKSGTYFWLGVMLSGAVGGLLAQFNFAYAIIFGILMQLVSVLIMSTVKTVKPQKSTGESKYFEILKEAIKEIRTSKKMLLILTFICLTFPIYGAGEEFLNLLFQSYQIDLWIIGLMVALIYGIIAVSNYTLTFIDKIKINALENWFLIISGVLFLIVGLTKSVLTLPLIFVAIYLLAVAEAKFDVRFQHAIESSERATISSLKSFSFEIFYLLFVLIFGFISSQFGLNSVILTLGGLTILATILLGIKVNRALTK